MPQIMNEGRTPLHCSVIKGNSRIVKRLIVAEGVNINATDMDGKTPLDFAVSQGNTECVELLKVQSSSA